jgi:hypothetical protein
LCQVTRCGSVRLRVTRSFVPVNPVGLSLLCCCSSSFMLASALLPSLSSLVPKASREIYMFFLLFMCDSWSCDWDIGRVLLRNNFYQLPFTPPLWSPIRSFTNHGEASLPTSTAQHGGLHEVGARGGSLGLGSGDPFPTKHTRSDRKLCTH